jgi:OmpA-OmpF porin, OOP family
MVMKLKTTLISILITSLSWAQGLQPNDSIALLKVRVQSEDGQPAPGQMVSFTDKLSGINYAGTSDDSGLFEILIPEGKTYLFRAEGFDGEDNQQEFDMPSHTSPIVMDFTVTTESSNQLDVTYKPGSAELEPSSYMAIDKLYDWMQTKNNISVEIAGHTDSDGSEATNQTLSQARAESVKKYLLKKGIEPSRIIAIGYGESKPIESNDTAQGKAKNRRTEVRILAQ